MHPGDLFSVSGKRVLITGASRGIGRMLAVAFGRAGARVHLTGRDREALSSVVAEVATHTRCSSTTADLSRVADRQRLVTQVLNEEPRLDVLINNAGATLLHERGEHPEDELDQLLAVNLKAPLQLTLALAGALRAAARPGAPSRVINIGSIDGIAVSPVPNYGYAASKAAVHMMTRHLARDLAPTVTVNAIAPGLFATDMTRGLLADPIEQRRFTEAIPLGRLGSSDDLAGAALYLASTAGSYLSGVVLAVDGGESGA